MSKPLAVGPKATHPESAAPQGNAREARKSKESALPHGRMIARDSASKDVRPKTSRDTHQIKKTGSKMTRPESKARGSLKEIMLDSTEASSKLKKSRSSKSIFATNSTYMNCVVYGVPFLTYNIPVNRAFLKKHKLELGKLYLYMQAELLNILKEALTTFGDHPDTLISPGGRALNVGRVIQWLLNESKSVVFMGGRSQDEYGKLLLDACMETDLSFCTYVMPENIPTSIHLVLHVNTKRCELYYVTQHSVFNKVSFVNTDLCTTIMERANIFLFSDIGIMVSGEALQKIAYYCSSRFKVLCVLLKDPNLVKRGKVYVRSILENADVIFLSLEMCTSYKTRAIKISNWVKGLSKKNCTIVVTDGLVNAYVDSDGSEKVTAVYQSPYWQNLPIRDESGTHCAFVGGFMAMMLQGHDIETNVMCGFFSASRVASKIGIYFTKEDYVAYKEMMLKLVGQHVESTDNVSMPFTVFNSAWSKTDLHARRSIDKEERSKPKRSS